ncbi:MAG: acyl-CoA thioesterase [Planctomycetales bacterium]
MPQFTHTHRVQFAETDMAGIVHFANFYRYMEETEHAFFRSLGFSIVDKQPDGTVIGWPRVRATCSFEAPAYYDDILEIDLEVTRQGVKSLTMGFVFRRGEQRLATGELKTCCCLYQPGGKFHSIEIPPTHREKLESASADPKGANGE